MRARTDPGPAEAGVCVTHREGCWREHHECAIAYIEWLEEQVAVLRASADTLQQALWDQVM